MSIYKTPGVYVKELSAFPPTVVGVATAVPGFIGYTEKAALNGKPILNKAVPIGSLAEYEQTFGKGIKPLYAIKKVKDEKLIKAGTYDFKINNPEKKGRRPEYFVLERTSPSFNLYDSMRLFYANGGGNCYVVSVGGYKQANGKDNEIALEPLQKGLDVLREQTGPTMIVIPDAVNLQTMTTTELMPPTREPTPQGEIIKEATIETIKDGPKEYYELASQALAQCKELQDRVAILDVYGSQDVKTKADLEAKIKDLRDNVGEDLDYGMVYFPFVNAKVFPAKDVSFTNLPLPAGYDPAADADPADEAVAADNAVALPTILTWARRNLYGGGKKPTEGRAAEVQADIGTISPEDDEKLNQDLTAALPLLAEIEYLVARKSNVLPASAAMAGVYTATDETRGVWNAPANVSLRAVESPTFKLNNKLQEDLNVPVDGKAVNALRELPGRGTVVWGARTLDGNSNDYRYIQVRRTLIYIEESIRAALNQFVFAPNDGNTWSTVVATVSGFLKGLWSQGGLMGATASEAFSVECGLGSTMTGQHVLDGYMIVQVTLQMIRPAEFIELTFQQKMEGVA